MRVWLETMTDMKVRLFYQKGRSQWDVPRGGSSNGILTVVLIDSGECCGDDFVSFSFIFKVS